MQQISIETLAAEWQALVDRYSPAAAVELQALADGHAEALSRHFYEQLLADPHAAQFLTHEQVRTHLRHSLERWVRLLFAAPMNRRFAEAVEQQRNVGEVHARIEIPVSLVLRGARLLKNHLQVVLASRALDNVLRHEVVRLGSELMDLAMEVMSFAFSQSHDRHSRAEEAYRLFSISHNVGAERERQRAALLDWESQLMFDLAAGNHFEQLPKLSRSEFGLWYRHKASHAFQGSHESGTILQYIEEVDALLPALIDRRSGTQAEGGSPLHQVRDRTRAIRYLLDGLFEQAGDLEAGRDVLTRLLNRKFLPVVLGKELLYSRQTGQHFAALMIDVDYFKTINDTYGHGAGDAILQQLAGLLTGHTRGGDYAFRMGGEEFLLILVDMNAERLTHVAEKLCRLIAGERFRLPQGGELAITVSIGAALHDGHPDYHQLLQRADQALYKAKNSGRNRVMTA